ncbi:MAG: M23 family metallopeptidase [Gammaproteobacteria bacterium]|jgi:murein DD-endopeptidase MepM/ murein hydrolase activator NlpD|nr:M23 family metallopeptidase [Gammaproteobacteria bacterium]
MNIIVRAKHSGASRSLNLSRWQMLLIAITVFLVLPAAALYTGKLMGEARVDGELVLPSEWKSDVDRNRQEIERLSRKAREDLNAMSIRLAQLQAQAIRINALGQRLVSIARLDEGEFDFSQPPAQGGPEAEVELTREVEPPDFIRSLDQLAIELEDREQRLRVLEDYFMTRNLQETVMPAGRPLKNGWVSSFYGMRTDPFTGRRAMHNGTDFAGKEGSDILAVAAGIVTYSGKRYGYGHMVEISHGNGYITRYAHNRENLVKAGDVVEKGQAIALLGSTGRSTGPHVHFEVLKNGRGVDPGSYIRAAK